MGDYNSPMGEFQNLYERREMGEFEFDLDWETINRGAVVTQVFQELAERGIHKDRLSDWSVKVVVTVYYDIERR